MSSFDFGDMGELSEEFQRGMDYSDSFLDESIRIRSEKTPDKREGVKSMEDADQALSDTLSYLATEGARKLDSSTIALLVKTLSDTRTILTSGDVMREDAETPKEAATEKDGEKPEEPKVVSTGESGGKVEQNTAHTTVKAETGHNDEDEHALRQLLAKLEQHVSWSQRGYKLDGGQIEYLDRVKRFVSGFKSINALLQYLLGFAPESEGRLFPSTVVFLMLVYLSDTPERYLPMFVLSPVEFYESPLTGARSYEFDGVLAYHDKITSQGA